MSRVLRLGPGAAVELLDDQGQRHQGTITAVQREQTRVELHGHQAPQAPPEAGITLVYGVARGHRTEWVLQKATELGVDVLRPCLCQRSVARPRQPEQKLRRWQEVVAQAARQAQRANLPRLTPLAELEQALAAASTAPVRLVALPGGPPLSAVQPQLRGGQQAVALAVGPEGGFTEQEQQQALALGYTPVGLGPNVLRTETAAVALVGLVAYLCGRLD